MSNSPRPHPCLPPGKSPAQLFASTYKFPCVQSAPDTPCPTDAQFNLFSAQLPVYWVSKPSSSHAPRRELCVTAGRYFHIPVQHQHRLGWHTSAKTQLPSVLSTLVRGVPQGTVLVYWNLETFLFFFCIYFTFSVINMTCSSFTRCSLFHYIVKHDWF